MRFLSAQPLRRQILVVTCTLLVTFAMVAWWAVGRTTLERQAEVREEAGSVAVLASAYLNEYFDGLDGMASAIVRHPAVTGLDAVASRALLADVLSRQPLLVNAVLRDHGGRLVASGLGGFPGRQDSPAPAPAYVIDVLRTGNPQVSGLNIGRLSGMPNIGQAYPVRGRDGSVVGALAFGLNVLLLQRVFDNLALPDGSVVTLIDRSGRVLLRSRDGERYIGQLVDERAGANATAAQLRKDVDGVNRFVASVPILRGPWALTVGIPQTVVADRIARLRRRNLTIISSGIVFVLALALWISHLAGLGLNRLRSAAERIAAGDLSPPERVTMPCLEITALQDAFTIMAANLRETRTALDRQVEQERSMREELQSLQRQVVRQERLAAVGLLVSGVAHELNNPLQAILGTAELVERHPGLSPEVVEELGLLKTQSSRAREIIRSLSRFGSQQSGSATLVDLRSVIAEVIQLRRHALEEARITLDVEAAASGRVHASLTELQQVTLNFVINAQQAIEADGRPNGRILIRLYDTGSSVRLEVHDNGPGVDPDNEAKLFQPFFTTKPSGKGTGLGLSVSYGIIDSYGGRIGHSANEWRGATFFFELPAADGPAGEPIPVSLSNTMG